MHSAPRPLLVAAALALAPACAENPSFEARWRLGPQAEGEDSRVVDSTLACTSVGIASVRVTTTRGGATVDTRDLPCFPDEFASASGRVGGPELDPGDYTVVFEGVLRDGASICEVINGSCDARRMITVGTGAEVVIDDLVLPTAPPCLDGVDNDGDGRTDGADPGCLFDGVREDNDLTRAFFSLRASFLDENPHATCTGVGVAGLRAEVRLEGVDAPVVIEHLPCSADKHFFAARLDPGVYTLTLVATTASDQAVATDAPLRFCVPTADPANDGCSAPDTIDLQRLYIDHDADFAIDEFAAPIVAPLRFTVEYEPGPGQPNRLCTPSAGGGKLTIDTITIAPRVVDAQGALKPVDINLQGGEPLAGTIPCPGAILVTEPLEWSSDAREYRLLISAAAPEGDTCFDTQDAAIRGAPGVTFVAVVPRSSSAGACADCSADSECGGCTDCCTDAGICAP